MANDIFQKRVRAGKQKSRPHKMQMLRLKKKAVTKEAFEAAKS